MIVIEKFNYSEIYENLTQQKRPLLLVNIFMFSEPRKCCIQIWFVRYKVAAIFEKKKTCRACVYRGMSIEILRVHGAVFFSLSPPLRTLLSFFLSISISICVPGTTPKRETIKLSNPPTMVIFQHSMSVKGGHFECRSSRVGIKKRKKRRKERNCELRCLVYIIWLIKLNGEWLVKEKTRFRCV